jgi:hypothetical protein
MTDIQVGSPVRWADAIREHRGGRVSLKELFFVKRVRANGRSDLVDIKGAELFNIPLHDLQLFGFEGLPPFTPDAE